MKLDWADDYYDEMQETLDRLEELEKQYDETKDPVERKHIRGEMEELESQIERDVDLMFLREQDDS